MSLVDKLFTDRIINSSDRLKDDNVKAVLAVLGASFLLTAAIGKQYFEMEKMTVSITGGSGLLMLASAVTEKDAFIAILGLGIITGTGVSMVQAFRDGRFYVKVDLAELLRLGHDVFKDKK